MGATAPVYSTTTRLLLAAELVGAPLELLRPVLARVVGLLRLVKDFQSSPPSPARFAEFETALLDWARELARVVLQWTVESHPCDREAEMLPQLTFQGECYRRGNKQKRRGFVATLFGPIVLPRVLYRAYTAGEPAIFPLEINLGIAPGGATPALALRAARLAGDVSQQAALEILKAEHGVGWSVETYRKVVRFAAGEIGEHRHQAQLARLLELLKTADESRGPRKIVLSVGRDGIFVPIRKSQQYQEAATATVAVHDRAGKRLGTVYLARMPEKGQPTLSAQLTPLIRDVLRDWRGPLPRRCYVTDAGHHPTEYFDAVLRPMRHPRTDAQLSWEWVLDYYHACLYVTKLSEAIFGAGNEAGAWARKMRHWLRDKPNGAFRVLHSAVALREKRGLRGATKQFQAAYRYLSDRLPYLQYLDYRRRGLPIGSGVTEAACKVVVTFRFKQSGMKWSIPGAQDILDLRVLRLGGVWKTATAAFLAAQPLLSTHSPTNTKQIDTLQRIAA